MSDVKEKNKQALGSIGNGIFGTVAVSSEPILEEKEKKKNQ